MASQLKMKTLKFNQCSMTVQCQVLTVPAHSKNWSLLSKGLVFPLKRCGKKDGIILSESRWAKAQINYTYCPKTHRKPKTKLAVNLLNPSTMTKPQLMSLTPTFMESRPFLPYSPWISAPGVRAATSVQQMLCPDTVLSSKTGSSGLLRKIQKNSLIGKCRIIYANEGLMLTDINFKPWSMYFYGDSKI